MRRVYKVWSHKYNLKWSGKGRWKNEINDDNAYKNPQSNEPELIEAHV